jgi:hypothetical protein
MGHFCGQKLHPRLGNFFTVENQILLFYNFNTASHGGLKNKIFEEKNLTECFSHLLGQKVSPPMS